MAQRRGILRSGQGQWHLVGPLDGSRWAQAPRACGHARRCGKAARQTALAKARRPEVAGESAHQGGRVSRLCEDALAYSRAENSAKQTYELGLRVNQLIESFGSRAARDDSQKRNRRLVGRTGQSAQVGSGKQESLAGNLLPESSGSGSTTRRSRATRRRASGAKRRAMAGSGSSPTQRRNACAPPSKAASRSPAALPALNSYRDADWRAVRPALEPGGFRAPAASSAQDQERRSAHHSV